ncbi:CAP domain-containing protein [Antarcticimicrobium sediminis]|uniref:CAP domain-containing protein n=1 Tax=Antarcticimicrobium sediminis TaxID=2546227 RepID=UPI00140460A2|nr:CAP domain-containing protein [Antarcticimicrobium sediminis]
MSIASDIERFMLDLVNAERAAAGLSPLKLEQHLNDSAEDHSTWILDEDVFSHTGLNGSSSSERMADAGFVFSGSWRSGENIGFQSERGAAGVYDDVEDIHDSLMASTGHRWNILNPDYEYMGIGIELGDYKGFDVIVVTQNFAATDGAVLLDTGESQTVSGTIVGDSGSNLLMGTSSADILQGFAGDDVLRGLGGADTLEGGNGADTIYGGTGNDALLGGGGADLVKGKNGDDTLYGDAGQDVLKGGSGQDTLDGGTEKDKLTGGANEDVFLFTDASHSAQRADRDVIVDFDRAQDIIDLSAIDANTTRSGDQGFTFIGTDAFSGTAGELRYRSLASDTKREIQGDIDGDGTADFFILVKGAFTLAADDFLL